MASHRPSWLLVLWRQLGTLQVFLENACPANQGSGRRHNEIRRSVKMVIIELETAAKCGLLQGLDSRWNTGLWIEAFVS